MGSSQGGAMATDPLSGSSNIFNAIALQQTLRESAANTALSSGVELMQKKKYEEAAQAFKRASIYKPEMTEAYTFLGDAYTRLGKKKEAIDSYTLSLKIDRTQDTLYSNIANLNIDLGKPADAEKALRDGIKQNNLNTPAYYTLGLMQASKGNYTDAEVQFRRVIQLEPKDANGYYGLGMALNGQGKYEDAIQPLEKAISLKKNFSQAIFQLGKTYDALGDSEKAKEQATILSNISTADGVLSARQLTNQITKPGILYYDLAASSLNLYDGPRELEKDPFNMNANERKEVTVKFAFDTDMNAESVMDISNWNISRASGGPAGFYNDGLYSPNTVATPSMPSQVSYDPVTREAILVFSFSQNSTATGTFDPQHLVFKFSGTDQNGKTMNPLADEFDGFSQVPF